MLVIAHRGASWELPENTLPAFERAIELGADFVELDVHADADGRLVVVTHDPPKRGGVYPTLEEALDLCRGRIGVMVELKTPRRYRRHDVVARTVRLLTDADVLICFQRPPLEEARALRPGIRTCQHVGYGVSIRARARRVGRRLLGQPRHGARARRGACARSRLARLHGERACAHARAREAGVAGIFTDRPELALPLFRSARR